MRRDWWTEATAWVDERLAAAGRQRTGDLEPKEHWGVSAVARVPATGGALWLKAVPTFFRREPAVLDVLAERLRSRVPRVFAVDAGQAAVRFLVEDAGAVPGEVTDEEPAQLAALLADIQIRALDLLPALEAAGCANRSPARLSTELARITEDGFELSLLEPTERATLRQQLPRLADQLLALADGSLPEVLVHGDFHPWNVVRSPGWSLRDAVIIDWTDAAIGLAGVDLVTLLPRPTRDGDASRILRSYASVWETHVGAPLHEVEAAVAATVPAAHVAQALAYDEILRSIEPLTRWQLAGAMAGHLRALLGTLPDGRSPAR
ncbi:MAG: aminoglycoside phosphotransferase family protein [Actinomycetes bacterium]